MLRGASLRTIRNSVGSDATIPSNRHMACSSPLLSSLESIRREAVCEPRARAKNAGFGAFPAGREAGAAPSYGVRSERRHPLGRQARGGPIVNHSAKGASNSTKHPIANPIETCRIILMKTSSFSAIACVLALTSIALGGCGTYRVVKKTPNGGEVALQGSPEKAREAAAEYMSAQCPQGYDIVEEGEAVVGSETTARTQKEKVFGVPTTSTTAETTDKREWRLKYQCKGAPTAAPQVAPADPAAAGIAGKNQGAIHELVIRY